MIQKSIQETRVAEIDLLRFLAALMIVLFHYTFRGYATDGLMDVGFPEVSAATKYLFLGVELFFMISGFVIMMTASSGSLRRFLVSRCVRLYPAFWFSCTLTFLVVLLFDDGRFTSSWPTYLANLTMLHEFLGIGSVDGVYWSLTVELKFYALISLVLFFGKISSIRSILFAWLAISVASHPLSSWTFDFVTNARYAPYFAVGCFAYLIYRDGPNRIDAFGILISWLLALVETTASAKKIGLAYSVSLDPLVTAGAITLFTATLILVAMGKTRWINFKGIGAVGALTYPLYLLHQNIGYVIFNRLADPMTRYEVLMGTIIAMVVLSRIVNRYVERPLAPRLRGMLISGRLATQQ